MYLGFASGGTAEPVPFLATWSINFAVATAEVTAFGDGNKIYVSGLPDASGDFSGFYDDASVQTFTASIDGIPRKWYLYPSTLTNTQYFFGTILPDFKVDANVSGPAAVSSTWNAASLISKVG